MSKKGIYAFIGFSLFIIGFLALFLMLVGVQLSFLTWIDAPGRLIGFLIRVGMILSGAIIIFLSQTDWRKEEPEHDYLERKKEG
ncbi:MAG: hypothetical protein ACI8P3_002003 [Saprospiraceae bacterium]|jgi:hypothetical protein